MKKILVMFALVLQTFTTIVSAADSILVEGVSCAVSVRKNGKQLFQYGSSETKKRLFIAYGSELRLADEAGQVWSASLGSSAPDVYLEIDGLVKFSQAGLVAKKEHLNDVNLSLMLTTDAFGKKIKGQGGKILTDTYGLHAETTAGAKKLGAYSGSFSAEISAYVDCQVISKEVDLKDF